MSIPSFPACAYGREQLSNSDWSIATNSSGNLSAATYYFSIQGRNRAGLNRPIYSGAISVPSNGAIVVTVNSSAKKDGEDWHYYVISASLTNAPNSFSQIAAIPVINPADQTTAFSFPLTLTLNKTEHLKLVEVVEEIEDLPVSPNLINGMLRKVNNTSLIYEYDMYDVSTPVDNVNVLSASTGRWKRTGGFFTLVTDITSPLGCGQDLGTITSFKQVAYVPSSSESAEGKLWLINQGTSAVVSGTVVSLTLNMAGIDVSNRFDNKLILKFLGYVNLSTGVLDTLQADGLTPFLYLNTSFNYRTGKVNFQLQKDLPSGYAFAFSVRAKFSSAESDGGINSGASLSVIPYFSAPQNSLVDNADLIGNCVYATEETHSKTLRRIVPGIGLTATALPGRGIIDPFKFNNASSQVISGLVSNTPNQKVAIVGSNGNCFVTDTIPATSALRAIVGTVSGESVASAYSNGVTLGSNSGISVTLNYPCNVSGKGTIRSDYGDVTKGSTEGTFNPKYINIYINNGTTIKKFSNYLVIAQPTQSFTISDWNNGNIVTELPSTAFGLYTPGAVTTPTSAGSGNFPEGTYTVAYSFVYDGEQVTSTNHTDEECISEIPVPLAKALVQGGIAGEVTTASNIGASGTGIYKQKTGVNLEFKKVKSASNKVSITDNTSTNTVDLDIVESNLTVTSSLETHTSNTNNPHSVTAEQVGKNTAQWNANKLQGRNLADTLPTDGQAIVWDNGNSTWKPGTVSGGNGETNTASNVGTAGVGVFKQKTGVDLEFKKINAGSNKIIIGDDSTNSEIDIDINESNLVVSANLATHIGNTNNPHNVTATQVGADPAGTAASVVALHSSNTNNPHVVTASQVGNTTAQWNANKLQGKAISTTSPTDGQVWVWNDTANEWQPGTISGEGGDTVVDASTSTKGIVQLAGDIGGTATSVSVTKIQGRAIADTVPTEGQVLTWDETDTVWKPAQSSNSSGGSGSSPFIYKNANYTATSGDRILIDTKNEAWTLTLPNNPTTGTEIEICGIPPVKNLLYINFNGKPFRGDNSVLVSNYKSSQLEKVVYVNNTVGWLDANDKFIPKFRDTIIASNPIGYWRLNETTGTIATDSSGNNKHGNYVGGYILDSESSILDKSIKLDGTTGYIDIPNASAPNGSNARTIMVLGKFTTLNSLQTLVSIGSGGGQHFMFTLGNILFTDGVNSENNVTLTANENPTLNEWTLLHFTFSNNKWMYYKDGLLIKNGTLPVSINTGGSGVRIGQRTDTVQGYSSSAYFDEVAIFNGALNGVQIAKHYAAFSDFSFV